VINDYGSGDGTIWLDDVNCTGSETSLADCTHDGWGIHNCHRSQDVAVFCGNYTRKYATRGSVPPVCHLRRCYCRRTGVHVINDYGSGDGTIWNQYTFLIEH